MARNKTYDKLLAEMVALHDAKNEDYAYGNNPYSNFEFAAQVAGVDVPTVFDVLIGIKQARLQSLREKAAAGQVANYESEQDTMLDQAVYTSLKLAWVRDRLPNSDQALVGALQDRDYDTAMALAQHYDEEPKAHEGIRLRND